MKMNKMCNNCSMFELGILPMVSHPDVSSTYPCDSIGLSPVLLISIRKSSRQQYPCSNIWL